MQWTRVFVRLLCLSVVRTHTHTHCLSLSVPLAHTLSLLCVYPVPSSQMVKNDVFKQLLNTRVEAEWLERGTKYLPCFAEVRWA